jgi:Tfp pilus assembly protein PilW
LKTYSANAATRRGRRGISMIECCFALAICSGLLTAVALAFKTSFDAVQLNDEFTRATQASRVSMNQLLMEIRRSSSVQVLDDKTLDVIRIESARPSNEIYRRYSYDSSARKLTFQVFYAGGTSGPLHTLASNVQSAKFGPAETVPESGVVVQVPVVITVKLGKSEIVLDGTAGPRQALAY